MEEIEEPQAELSVPRVQEEKIPINNPVNNQPESESMTGKIIGEQKSHSDV